MLERLILWVIFMAGGTLGYQRAEPVWAVVLVAMLLTLPHFVRNPEARTLSLTTVASGANALFFAAASYGIGRGIAWLLAA